jgi:extradiol dioxygenase family protein
MNLSLMLKQIKGKREGSLHYLNPCRFSSFIQFLSNIQINMQPFHLAFPVTNLEKAHDFYHGLLGCPIGRTSDRWIDFNFWGSQITAHLVDADDDAAVTNAVDGKSVPVKHFGAILEMGEWEVLAEKLKAAGTVFVIEPYIRFKGEVGEQATMFFLDPSGNAIEFKSFKDFDQIFAK